MNPRSTLHTMAMTMTAMIWIAGAVPTAQPAPLAMDTARVTIAGTSNVHNYTVWTDTVRVTRVKLAPTVAAGTLWDDVVKPGALQAFEVSVPVATLTSRDAGLDRQMYEALKGDANRDIVFSLKQLEQGPTGALMAIGTLRIAGVAREVVLRLDVERRDETLVVKGRLPLLMTDFGITPPTAMIGILKADPKVIVSVEAVLSVPRT
jgi:polyisoprenoid-binding protein YceI